MSFLHPWAIWIGAAAAAGPLVIHWLTRPRPVRMPLSTVRFVREAIRQRRARHRLRDFLILALRTLAVVLLALAVARPRWGTPPPVAEPGPGWTLRVVVLDASQSMAAAPSAVELFEQARARAAQLLAYHPRLRANLIVAAARPRAVFEQPSSNLRALREQLARLRVLPQRLDANRALEMAARMLSPSGASDRRRRELVVISDFQRANWSRADFSLLPPETVIQLESVGPGELIPNLAIVRAEAHGAGAQAVGGRLEVEVGNFSRADRRVEVEVEIGTASWRMVGVCPAGGTATLSQTVPLRDVGWQWGQARLVGIEDPLAADNARLLAVHVRPRPRFALVTRQPATLRPSSSHFLECALVPDAHLSQTPSAMLQRVDPEELDARELAGADLIVLDHPGKLSAAAIQLLADLLRRGRPILYVAAEPADAINLERLADAVGDALKMPVGFAPRPATQTAASLALASVADRLPPFDVFGDRVEELVRALRFRTLLTSYARQGGLREDIRALYEDGSACLVVSQSAAGTLAVLNADLGSSNLPRTPAFVPLLDSLVAPLLERRRRTTVAMCGEPVVVQLPAEAGSAAGLEIVPAGQSGSAMAAGGWGSLSDGPLGVAWHWSEPGPPGVYQVRRGEACVFALAVNTPAEESRLESLPGPVLTERLAAGRHVYYHSVATQTSHDDDSWKHFLVACVVCLLGEVLLLAVFRS